MPQSRKTFSSRRKVALVVETSNTYARDVLHGLRAWMREHEGWSIRLSEHGRGADVPGWLAGWRGDGIIARVENDAIVAALQATGLPVVDVSAALSPPVFPQVITNSTAVTRLAADHLLERGIRHFGYCGDPRFRWSAQRAELFGSHLARAGFTCDNFAPPNGVRLSVEAEVRAIARWVTALPKPAGVLACYDVRGQQVLEACRLAGVSVPDAVAVIGVHNDELLCDLCDPPLTSVIPNARQAGYVAADLLAQMMRGRRVPSRVHTIQPVGVAARQSTDVLAVADSRVAAALRFIRENGLRNIGVRDVLQAVPMARTLLERKFKHLLGCTPHEHIQRLRMEHVKSLLLTTDLPIGVIAERTGFAHPEYLSVAFRRATRSSPKRFRQLNRPA